jgi:hypothetical protein
MRDAQIEHDIIPTIPKPILNHLSDATSLALLTQTNPREIPISFAYGFEPGANNRQKDWMDIRLALLGLSVMNEDSALQTVLWYFRDPASLELQRLEEAAMHLDSFLQTKWLQYCNHTLEILERLLNTVV